MELWVGVYYGYHQNGTCHDVVNSQENGYWQQESLINSEMIFKIIYRTFSWWRLSYGLGWLAFMVTVNNIVAISWLSHILRRRKHIKKTKTKTNKQKQKNKNKNKKTTPHTPELKMLSILRIISSVVAKGYYNWIICT